MPFVNDDDVYNKPSQWEHVQEKKLCRWVLSGDNSFYTSRNAGNVYLAASSCWLSWITVTPRSLCISVEFWISSSLANLAIANMIIRVESDDNLLQHGCLKLKLRLNNLLCLYSICKKNGHLLMMSLWCPVIDSCTASSPCQIWPPRSVLIRIWLVEWKSLPHPWFTASANFLPIYTVLPISLCSFQSIFKGSTLT